MKKILFALLCVATLSSCAIEDCPEILIDKDTHYISAAGGELNIELTTTGLDDVDIDYHNNSEWIYDQESDSYVPANEWIEIVTFTNNNNTRALPLCNSGITLNILPNDSGYERKAYLEVTSFNKSETITIIQTAN
jgi:hypothetical protein